jgi:hypothetical protein
VAFQSGGDSQSIRKLAVYDPSLDTWTGFTSAAPEYFSAGSEAEYLDGKIYVWGGSYTGGAVNGSDSYLQVYDIATNSWSVTPSLQSSGVIPGFRSGAFDVWGVGLTADSIRGLLFVIGGETNRQLYVFDTATQTWAAGPTAPYDGGWGDSLEYVMASDTIYQIDGRNAQGIPQGTAAMLLVPGDFDDDRDVDLDDFAEFVDCFTGPDGGPVSPECTPADFDCDDDVDCTDWDQFAQAWTEPEDPPNPPQCPGAIPTVSAWGLVFMTLLVVIAGTLVFRRRMWVRSSRAA